MASGLAIVGEVPDINDLVRVNLGAIDDPDGDRLASNVPSRVEDVARDVKTGQVLAYLIAAPWFSGDLEAPEPETECALQWPTPRGLCMLPAAFQSQETTARGLRVWRVKVTGPPRREERRRFVRVPWSLPTVLTVRRDLDALGPEMRRLVELSPVRATLKDLPDTIEAEALNVSEGGLLCLTRNPVLPTHLPLISTFAIESRNFEIASHVVWSLIRDGAGKSHVESALAFDEPSRYGEILRPLLFQAQLRARRAGLA